MRDEQAVAEVIDRYGDTVKRLCIMYLKNQADTEDIFQTVFLKYALHSGAFESREHEKAWIIRVTVNACKDLRRSFFRSHTVSLEDVLLEAQPSEENREVLEAVLTLPENYRQVVYLHFFEGYSPQEIGKILGKNTNTVYTWMSRAKARLKEQLGGDGGAA